jgi:hypothetical protein
MTIILQNCKGKFVRSRIVEFANMCEVSVQKYVNTTLLRKSIRLLTFLNLWGLKYNCIIYSKVWKS